LWNRLCLLLAVLGTMMLIACDGLPFQTPKPTVTPSPTLPLFDREAETYQIYRQEIQGWCSTGGPIAVDPELPSHSASPPSYEYLDKDFHLNDIPAEFERETYDDYIRDASIEPFVLNQDYDFGLPIQYMSSTEFRRLVDKAGGDESFNRANPDYCGYVELSRIGFNNTGTQALLFFGGHTTDKYCLETYYLLQKIDDSWSTVAESLQAIC